MTLPDHIKTIKDRLNNLDVEIAQNPDKALDKDLIPELLDDAMALIKFIYDEHTTQDLDALESDEMEYLSKIIKNVNEVRNMDVAGMNSPLNLYISQISIGHEGDNMPYTITPSETGKMCLNLENLDE